MLDDIQGRKHHNPVRSAIALRKSGRLHKRRVYLGHCFVRRGQPHLGEPKALKIRNGLLKEAPPGHFGMFAIPGEELDLCSE